MDLHSYRLHLVGALLVLASLVLIILYSAFGGPKKPSLSAELSADFAPLPVPPEALFLPAEPEIIPEVLLSRKPRTAWSASDAAPFWTDPRTLDQLPLKSAADKEVDDLFSAVR